MSRLTDMVSISVYMHVCIIDILWVGPREILTGCRPRAKIQFLLYQTRWSCRMQQIQGRHDRFGLSVRNIISHLPHQFNRIKKKNCSIS